MIAFLPSPSSAEVAFVFAATADLKLTVTVTDTPSSVLRKVDSDTSEGLRPKVLVSHGQQYVLDYCTGAGEIDSVLIERSGVGVFSIGGRLSAQGSRAFTAHHRRPSASPPSPRQPARAAPLL